MLLWGNGPMATVGAVGVLVVLQMVFVDGKNVATASQKAPVPLCSVAVVGMRANAGETWRCGRAVALAAERCAASGHAGGGEPDAGGGGRGAVQQHQDALGGDHECANSRGGLHDDA